MLIFFATFFHPEINKATELSKVLSCMKMPNITPLCKKGSRAVKDDYRLVSILPI